MTYKNSFNKSLATGRKFMKKTRKIVDVFVGFRIVIKKAVIIPSFSMYL